MSAPVLDDPHRLVVAIHELGHAVVWRARGFTIDEIRVKGSGPCARGWVSLANPNDHLTPDGERGFQAGLLAAKEAQRRWCGESGMEFDAYACQYDMEQLRKRARTNLGRQVKPAEVTALARQLVRDHWRRIVHLAPNLAARGSLAPSRI